MCHGKAVSVLYSECVSVTLVIKQAKRMRRIIFSCGLSGSAVFPHYVKRHNFRTKVIDQKMCF